MPEICQTIVQNFVTVVITRHTKLSKNSLHFQSYFLTHFECVFFKGVGRSFQILVAMKEINCLPTLVRTLSL